MRTAGGGLLEHPPADQYDEDEMIRTLPAIYEHGVLRPLEPVHLKENQQVAVTISDSPDDFVNAWLDHEYIAAIEARQEPEPSLEEVRAALAKIPGNLSDDIRTERESRG
jgi:predicted DNA-binding antitoxin AbrB/MazE fold protein